MEYKNKNLKRFLTDIQYVGNCEASNEIYKLKHFKFIFQYKTNFLAAILFIALAILFIIMMIYVTLDSEHQQEQIHHESLILQKKKPILSQISLTLNSETKDPVLKLSENEKIIRPDLRITQDIIESKRSKRQVPKYTDCFSRHDECKIILNSVRDITKLMQEKLDKLFETLLNQGFLTENDSKENKFRKIAECFQCKNFINYKDDVSRNSDPFLTDSGRNMNDQISDLLPFFEDNIYENNEINNAEIDCDELVDNSTPKPYQETRTPNSRVDAVHKSTISLNIEQSPQVALNMDSPVIPQQHLQFNTFDIKNSASCEEPQMTNNVGAKSIMHSTGDKSQSNQEIEFTPQNNLPYIPVCFYEPPLPSNSYQFVQNPGSSFFTAYTSPQGINFDLLNQPITPINQPQQLLVNISPQPIQSNTFSVSQQQTVPVSHFPQQQLTDSENLQPLSNLQYVQIPIISPIPQAFQTAYPLQLPMRISNQQLSQQRQQNSPYYCTYIIVPLKYQQQIPPLSNRKNFSFDIRAKENISPTKEDVHKNDQINDQNQPKKFLNKIFYTIKNQLFSNNTEKNVTNTNDNLQERNVNEETNRYQNILEQSYINECSGFMCNPPYENCLKLEQRCDGLVDCKGADDEINCPSKGYYLRFGNTESETVRWNLETRMMSTVSTFEEEKKSTTASNFEEMQKQLTTNKFEDQIRYMSSNTAPGEMRNNNATTNINELRDKLNKTLDSNGRNERTTTNSDQTTMISENRLLGSVTERSLEADSTTIISVIPHISQRFICKRIMQTILIEKRCDNIIDCEDASDEEDCMCKDYLKLHHPSTICDGHVDCPDSSDENECELCRENEYNCYRSGGCIPKHKICDQFMDCKLNEDELDCFALTNGYQVNLDLDKRPHLNLEGILTRYDNGVWRPSCFKSEFRDTTRLLAAGEKICEYLGFRNVDFVNMTMIHPSKLVEKLESKVVLTNNDNLRNFKFTNRDTNITCYGLHMRCKPILDKKLNFHLKINQKCKERNYIWPWEASIFVEGQYYCPAVLLSNNLLLSSSKCSEYIDLSKNYTVALFGVTQTKLISKSAYEQLSLIVKIKSLHHSDASLFTLKDSINMTRYVQPLYLEKRIFPPSKDDICVALGSDSNYQRYMQFLEPVVNACPKCHRCFSKKSATSTYLINNSTMTWSGYVVCLSSRGWYPAAVFKDKNENGFESKQVLNSIDYIHAHLLQAIDEVVKPFKEPFCDGIRCSLGQCISWEKVCDGIHDCREGSDENPEQCEKLQKRCKNGISECKCSKSELSCGNGKCIPKEMFCDGKKDCPNGVDEPAICNCGTYLKLTEPKRVCDGRRHCIDKSDERYQECLCKDSSFTCHKSSYNETKACISQDFVCDGEPDCPNEEDESNEVCWTLKSDERNIKGRGEIMRRSFGVLQSECFAEPIQSQKEVSSICIKLGYRSGVFVDGSRVLDSQFVPRDDFYMFQLNNNVWITMRNDVSFGFWKKPKNRCYRIIVHCF